MRNVFVRLVGLALLAGIAQSETPEKYQPPVKLAEKQVLTLVAAKAIIAAPLDSRRSAVGGIVGTAEVNPCGASDADPTRVGR